MPEKVGRGDEMARLSRVGVLFLKFFRRKDFANLIEKLFLMGLTVFTVFMTYCENRIKSRETATLEVAKVAPEVLGKLESCVLDLGDGFYDYATILEKHRLQSLLDTVVMQRRNVLVSKVIECEKSGFSSGFLAKIETDNRGTQSSKNLRKLLHDLRGELLALPIDDWKADDNPGLLVSDMIEKFSAKWQKEMEGLQNELFN